MAPLSLYDVRTVTQQTFEWFGNRCIPRYDARQRSDLSKNRIRESPGETIIREARDHLRAAR
jgi:hypothetical protein